MKVSKEGRKACRIESIYSNSWMLGLLFALGLGVADLSAQDREIKFSSVDSVYKEYTKKENYYPFTNKEIPFLSYKISFVIIQDLKRNLGMKNDDISRKSLQKSVKIMNDHYCHNAKPIDNIPGREYIEDVKIRARISNIYFLDDSTYYESKSLAALSRRVHAAFPETRESIIIVLNQFNYTGALGWTTVLYGQKGWPSYQPIIQTLLVNSIYIAGNELEFAQHWLHEVNHLFDLNHIYTKSSGTESCDPTRPDYLSDVFGDEQQTWCDNPYRNCKVCFYTEENAIRTNNIMSGNNINSPSKAAYFSPMQIARIHRHSTTHAIGYWLSSRRKSIPKKIEVNTSITFPYILRGNLVVKEGKTLTIKSKLYLDKKAKVILEPNAILIVDGGSIEPLGFGHRKARKIKVLGEANDNRIILLNGGKIVRKVKENGEEILQ